MFMFASLQGLGEKKIDEKIKMRKGKKQVQVTQLTLLSGTYGRHGPLEVAEACWDLIMIMCYPENERYTF
jgi:hypothetical protein